MKILHVWRRYWQDLEDAINSMNIGHLNLQLEVSEKPICIPSSLNLSKEDRDELIIEIKDRDFDHFFNRKKIIISLG